MVERLFLAVPGGCLQFVIVVFPDHTHLLFLYADVGGIKQVYHGLSTFSGDNPLSKAHGLSLRSYRQAMV